MFSEKFSLCLLFLCCLMQKGIQASPENPTSLPTPQYRLPTTLIPTNYNLRLFVVLDPLTGFERFTATGEVSISVNCVESTSQIYLHSANLTIASESVKVLKQPENTSVAIADITFELENDFFIISVEDVLESGSTYVIQVFYQAPIPDYRLNGMYQDFYEDPETSEIKYLATTLFAPYHSRRLFPCFDEPSFRAEYEVEIGHHEKYHAMANEEITESRPVVGVPNYVWDKFRKTPSISSYITAMIVSDTTYEEAPPTEFLNRTVRLYAAPHLISKGAGEYSARLTDAVMGFYENRFIIKYPLSKLYSIALPHFFFSAMENMGMITYKEPVILYLKNETTEDERYTINYIVGHELAHQYFGNIVACKWWAYVWLKEGFSTFYSHYATNHTNPELKPWEMFIPKILAVAMDFDSTNKTHPLENFPLTSAAVADIYTSIPYQKGASVLRMTSTFLTEVVFETAIRNYVETFQYRSAEQNDLFDILQEALDESPPVSVYIPASMRDIMNSWCQQSRFPIIYASLNSDTSQLQLTQEEFNEEDPPNSTITWWVPINLQPRSRPDLPGTVPDIWIPQGVHSISIEITPGEVPIVNPDATGYYRVLYDEKLQKAILNLLNTDHTQIPATGRSKLLDDYFQFALAGYVSFEDAMDFTLYLHKDTSTAVWTAFHGYMSTVLKLLSQIEDQETATLLKSYLSSQVKLIVNSLQTQTKENGLGSNGMLYELLIKFTSALGSYPEIFDIEINSFMQNPETLANLPKESQFAVSCLTVSRDSGNGSFDFLLKQSTKSTTLFGRKQRYLNALACVTDPDKIKKLVNFTFTDSDTMNHEQRELLRTLVRKPHMFEYVLEILSREQEKFFERFENIAEDILSELADNSNNEVSSLKITDLINELKETHPTRADRVESKLLRARRRQALLKKEHLNLRNWLYAKTTV